LENELILNGERGKHVEVFYCLDICSKDRQVIITDQRQHISGALGATKVGLLVERCHLLSVCLATSVQLIFEYWSIPND
jgi:hypothetical protein